MAYTRVNPGDPIQAHQLDQVVDSLNGTAGAGQPVALTNLADAVNYALTVQNTEAGNSRALNVLKSDGSTLIKADASGVTLGAPLTLPSSSVPLGALAPNSVDSSKIVDGTIATADLANAAVTNAKLASDTARLNLLTNGGMEIWQRGNGPFTATGTYCADRWIISLSGTDTLSVTRDVANRDIGSTACAACVFVHGTGTQVLLSNGLLKATDGYQIAGKTISLSIRVRANAANSVRIAVGGDGTGAAGVLSAFHSGGNTYETLSVTYSVPNDYTFVQPYVQFVNASCTAYLDNAMLVVGSQAADYAPLHPADDLARCLRYYEAPQTQLRIMGIATAASQQADTNYQYKARKAVTPTVTINAGAWAPTNCSNPPVLVGSANLDGHTLEVNSSAAGVFYNSSGANGFFVEANP